MGAAASRQRDSFQANTFQSGLIDQEFGRAVELGLTVMRVFLHNLLWQEAPKVSAAFRSAPVHRSEA
jgi:hypothetical protein